jgi:hypothetical protein
MAPMEMYQEKIQTSIDESKKLVEEFESLCEVKGVCVSYWLYFLFNTLFWSKSHAYNLHLHVLVIYFHEMLFW